MFSKQKKAKGNQVCYCRIWNLLGLLVPRESDISGVVAPSEFPSHGLPSHLSQAATGMLLSLQLQVRSRRMLVYSFVVHSGCEYLSKGFAPVVFATKSLPHVIFVTERSSLRRHSVAVSIGLNFVDAGKEALGWTPASDLRIRPCGRRWRACWAVLLP